MAPVSDIVGTSLWDTSAFCSKKVSLSGTPGRGLITRNTKSCLEASCFQLHHPRLSREGLKMEFMKNHATWWRSKNIPKIGGLESFLGVGEQWDCLPFPQGSPYTFLPSSSPPPLFNNLGNWGPNMWVRCSRPQY